VSDVAAEPHAASAEASGPGLAKTALAGIRVALVGNPNCGKTALFNALTGSRQRVANYPGVTVERKEGAVATPSGRTLRLLDLPGTYSLRARSPDEEVTRDVVLGRMPGEPSPTCCSASPTRQPASRRPPGAGTAPGRHPHWCWR